MNANDSVWSVGLRGLRARQSYFASKASTGRAQGKPEIPVRREASAVAGHLGGVGRAVSMQRLHTNRSGAVAQGVHAQRRGGVLRRRGDALQPGDRRGRCGVRRRWQLRSYRAAGEVRKVGLRSEIAGKRDHRLPVCEARPGISAVRGSGGRDHRGVHAGRHCGSSGGGGGGSSSAVVATGALPLALERRAELSGRVTQTQRHAHTRLGSYRDRSGCSPALLGLSEHA